MNGVTINFKPSVKQFQAWEYLFDKDTLFVGYGGAAFSGKSYLLCYWLVSMCISFPETSWGLGRKELINLKKTTLVTLFKVFAECNIVKDRHYNYNQQENKITFTNGSIIYLIDTAHKPSDPLYTRFGGLELTGAAIDESAETPYEAIKILFTRLGRKNNHKYGIKKKMLETFNPSKTHVYERYYRPHKENQPIESHVFVPALPKDNPSPDVEDYINDIIKTSDPITIQRLIHGNFEYDDDPNALIEYENILNLFTNNHVGKTGKKYITADIARLGSDKAVIMVWDEFTIIDIFEFDKSKTTEIQNAINALKVKHKIPNSNIVADEDGVGGGVVDNCRIKGFVNNSRPFNNENYSNLKTQCYYKLSEKINSNEVYFECELSASQKELIIEDLEQVKSHNADNDGKMQIVPKAEIKQVIGRSPDYSDSMAMRMFFDLKPKVKLKSSSTW